MQKTAKGQFGYIQSRRRYRWITTVLFLLVIFAMYFGARIYFGTNRNVFSILAALLCLPGGNSAVNLVMFLRAKPCSDRAAERIRSSAGDLAQAYDLYLTTYERNYAVAHSAAAGKTLCALTEDSACDVPGAERHMRGVLLNEGIHGVTVKVFTDPERYAKRLEEMRQLTGPEDPAGEKILRTLLSVSL